MIREFDVHPILKALEERCDGVRPALDRVLDDVVSELLRVDSPDARELGDVFVLNAIPNAASAEK